jgi:O-antigen/teichoic acid export membrane protein
VILKLAVVLVLPYVTFDKLVFYAGMLLGITLLNFMLNVIFAKTHFMCLRITRYVDISLLKKMISFSGWNLLGTFAFMLRGQGVNLLLNSFFGTVVNAARGVAYQVNSAITGFSSNISMAFKPQMVSSYAQGNIERSLRLFTSQSKICFCLMLMLTIPLIMEMDLVLRVWLGEAVPEYTNVFEPIVLAQSTVGTLNPPLTQLVFATGNIRRFQIYSSSVNILLLPVCWVFLHLGYDAWIVFIISFIFTILNQCVCFAAMRRVLEYQLYRYIKEIILPCFSMAILCPIIPLVITKLFEDSIGRLFLVSIASIIATVSLLYVLFLTTSAKRIVQQYVQNLIRKRW